MIVMQYANDGDILYYLSQIDMDDETTVIEGYCKYSAYYARQTIDTLWSLWWKRNRT